MNEAMNDQSESGRGPAENASVRRSRVPEVLGHRGFPARYPENTLVSFRAAMECGADGIEFDIQKTADGRFAVIHDDMLERTTSGKGPVGEKTMAELKALDAGEGESIPELIEVLKELKEHEGSLINIELKEETLKPDDAEAILAVISPFESTYRFLISSFDHDLLPPFARRGYRTGLLIGEQHQSGGLRGLRASIRSAQPTNLNLPHQVFERIKSPFLRPALRLLRVFGPKPAYWTVNTEEELRKVRSTAAVVISNDPELMLRLLGA